MKLIRASDIYYFVYNLEEIVTQVLNENQEQYWLGVIVHSWMLGSCFSTIMFYLLKTGAHDC